jgi:hypothetical protein
MYTAITLQQQALHSTDCTVSFTFTYVTVCLMLCLYTPALKGGGVGGGGMYRFRLVCLFVCLCGVSNHSSKVYKPVPTKTWYACFLQLWVDPNENSWFKPP